MGSAPTNGNLLLLTFTSYRNDALGRYATISSISQTGVTWIKQISKTNPTDLDHTQDTEIWAGVVGSGASATITITLAYYANAGGIADVCEYSGMLTSGFLDKTATNSGLSSSPDTGTTATTAQADELWIGCTGLNGSRSQSTPTNGFTLLDGAVYSSCSCAYLEKIVSATGTANSGTTGSGSAYWAGCIATFKASAAPPPAGGVLAQVM
jgi:hypothetical protein